MLYLEASLTSIYFGLFNCSLLATTNTAEALRSALRCWLTWTCQFKLYFIVLSADNNIIFISSIYTFG